MDWTLERVNVPNEFIVLNKNLRSYPCGRSPANFLVCSSLVVSRRHCLFVRTEDGISVVDLSSSNGVYVDGQLSETRALVELREGNVIGIGSPELYRDDEPMFVYKLRKENVRLSNSSNVDQKIKVRECSVEVLKLPSNMTAERKRELLLEDRMKQKIYEMEQKKKRAKSKWMRNVQLLLGSRGQKLKIANYERRERLKQLAEK